MPGLSAAAVPTAVAVDEGTEVMHGLLNHRSHARHEWDGVALPPTPQHQQVNLKNVAVRRKQANSQSTTLDIDDELESRRLGSSASPSLQRQYGCTTDQTSPAHDPS